MPPAKFDVFLSYNHDDQELVLRLARQLQDRGLKVWIDVWSLPSGEPWLPHVEQAIAQSRACAVAVGPAGLGGVHAQEMWTAVERSLSTPDGQTLFRVIPVLLPNSTRGDRSQLPRFLRRNTWIEFHRSLDEPEALDRLIQDIRGEPRDGYAAVAAGACPYRGLAHFDVADEPLFFGREALTDWLLSRLRGTASKDGPTRFLAIVGASGSGKSSLARAGVLAKLKQGELTGSSRWPVVICRPENRPLEALAAALASTPRIELGTGLKSDLIRQLEASLANSEDALHKLALGNLPPNDADWRLVIFVDQFEELFTLNPTGTELPGTSGGPALTADRVAFVRNLLYAATITGGRTIVVLTMRADFYGKCTLIPELAAAVAEQQELVGPMSADELRRAIEIPARLSGSSIEPGLVEILTAEVVQQPGALPLLQYALAELWRTGRERGDGTLTTAAYRELGGWEGALSQRADAVFAKFKGTLKEQQCRQLFLRLVQPGEGTEDTKRLVRWQELPHSGTDAAELEQTVRELVDSRLITASTQGDDTDQLTADSTVEVIHEALVRGWGELRKWLDADRAALRTHRQLTEAANEWGRSHAEIGQRDPSLLYTGTRLALASELAKRGDLGFSEIENQFLDVSTQALRARRRRAVVTWVGVAVVVIVLAVVGTLVAHYNQNETRAREMVESLKSAKESEVPAKVEALGSYWKWADPPLRQMFSNAAANSSEKLHAALALAPVDPAVIPYLRERLLTGTPAQFEIIRDSLAKHDPERSKLVASLWTLAQDAQNPVSRRFQACCALATYTPDDARWSEVSPAIVQYLVGLPAGEMVAWREALKPARKQLLNPLAVVYRNKIAKEQARTYAAETLAEYAADDADLLFNLLADAEPFQFPTIYAKVADHRPRIVELGSEELARQPTADASEEDRETLGQRQANVDVALLKLGAAEHVWNLFKHSPDPQARSNLIHWLSPLGGDPQVIIRRFDEEPEISVRRALLLALGEFNEEQLPPSAQVPFIAKLKALFENDPDPGLHAAVEWLLRRWGQAEVIQGAIEKLRAREPEVRKRQATGNRQWYVTSQGQTFVILEAGEFLMGSPVSEADHHKNNDEVQHRRRIGRRLAIGAREVTRGEYRRFLEEHTDVRRFDIDPFSRSADSPQIAIDWYDSARYCNWLSKTEGIPEDEWCYEPNTEGKYAEGMRLAASFLKRTGYRLPTEAEWEFACRAGAVTSRYYGSSLTLLPKYAWFVDDSPGNYARVTGLLKPNDFGLFDALGNVWEWCNDHHGFYPVNDPDDGIDDDNDYEAIDEIRHRILRGGSFSFLPQAVRSAFRDSNRPTYRYSDVGFRPARTYP